ncbi:hypothetical protein OPT61_g7174 [Boeremia exigua]|uniref:Uncharacterized protein n=1 Tax=Boeremia exigua TaxID=749465 RepID=A0ACC2I4J9_9PLEO|nr:hypothetical protein OPT61_g7174 [Boeremia exigua]
MQCSEAAAKAKAQGDHTGVLHKPAVRRECLHESMRDRSAKVFGDSSVIDSGSDPYFHFCFACGSARTKFNVHVRDRETQQAVRSFIIIDPNR